MLQLPIIDSTYLFYREIYLLNETMPKREKFSIGKDIENTILRFIKNIILAKNTTKPQKSVFLIEAQSLLEIITIELRLIHDLKIVKETRIHQLHAKLAEIGKMLGGWIKSL